MYLHPTMTKMSNKIKNQDGEQAQHEGGGEEREGARPGATQRESRREGGAGGGDVYCIQRRPGHKKGEEE